jgi:hypothetical protein
MIENKGNKINIKLIAMIYLKTVESGVKHHNSNPIQMRLLYSTTNTRDFYIKLMNVYFYYNSDSLYAFNTIRSH